MHQKLDLLENGMSFDMRYFYMYCLDWTRLKCGDFVRINSEQKRQCNVFLLMSICSRQNLIY